MTRYFLIAATALLIVVLSVPLVKKGALRWGGMDKPNERKLHTHPLPRLGGLAIYLGCMGALAAFDRFYLSQIAGILLGATLVSFLGIWDDYRPLTPLIKLVGQIAAATILIASGIKVNFLTHPVLNIAATLLWVVFITNALNLLDSMDGLSAGVATIACTFFLLMAVMTRQVLVSGLAAALLGACLGFLLFNYSPASIFMGDSGSLFIGFVLAALGIKLRFMFNVAAVTWMIPVIVLGLPIFDTTLVVLSRWRRGLNPFCSPGKDHVPHRLVAMGATQREAVLILYLVCCALGAMAMFLMHATKLEAILVAVLLLAGGLYGLHRFERAGSLK